MKPEIRDYIRYRMDRAQETLEVADMARQTGHLHEAVSRLYYACFYMVSALLLVDGLSSTKHTGVRSLFFQHWIKTGRLPKDMAEIYQDLFDNRQKSDYEDLAVFDCEQGLRRSTRSRKASSPR